MAIIILCPSCQGKGSVPDSFPGGRIKCPKCGNRFEVAPAKASPTARGPSSPAPSRPTPAPTRPAPPKAVAKAPLKSWMEEDEDEGVADVPEPIQPRSTRPGAVEASRGGNPALIYALIGIGGAAVVLLLVVAVLLLSPGRSSRPEKHAEEVAEAEPAAESIAVPITPTSATIPTPAPPAAIDTQEVIGRLKEATVYIKNLVNGRLVSTGTGFVIENLGGNRVLLATNRHVAVPDLSELPEEIAPEGVEPQIEVVFRSGQGGKEQAVPAKIIGADLSGEMDRDLAILIAEGVQQPPKPIDPWQKLEPTEGMRYRGGGFPLGGMLNGPGRMKANPSITVTSGSVSALRNDDYGQLAVVQIDGSLQPGNSGGPIVDEKTGRLIGLAVAKVRVVDTIGFVVPAEHLRQVLNGRVGALDLRLTAAPSESADLEVRAQLVDPRQRLKGVVVHAAAADGLESFRPNPDGSWPPLPNTKGVELSRDPEKPQAGGRVQIALNSQGQNPRKVMIQAAHRDTDGKLVFEKPMAVELPEKPGRIVEGGFAKFLKAQFRKSLAKLGPLVDPDADCRLKKEPGEFKVSISVPGKKVHSLSPELVRKKNQPMHNAPMTLAPVKGDFAALVKVTGELRPGSERIKDTRHFEIPITFQGAGLVLYEDRNNFLRLERCGGTAGSASLVHRLLIEVVREGKQAMQPIYLNVPEGDMTLIMVRRKGRIRCLFSPDSKSIIAFREFDFDFSDKVKIGLSATNISKRPFDATFEQFAILDDMSQIDDEFGD